MSAARQLALLASALWLILGGCGGPGLPGGDNTGDPNTPGGPVTLSGKLNPGQAAKSRPQMQAQQQEYPFTVVAQSDQTGTVYRVETDTDGAFELELPAAEAGNSFVVTILGPDGRAVGPVIVGTEGDSGVTGLALERDANLGTLDLPDDPTASPIVPGADGDAGGLADPNLTTRLNDEGAPLGLASVGKGGETATAQVRTGGQADTDQDGLIDLLDADDDGDGVVDDFDKGDEWIGAPSDIHVNFFMNLKVQAAEAQTYYAGTEEEIAAALSQQTVITFEVLSEPGATRTITGAHLLETPGPAYLATATLLGQGWPGAPQLWRDAGYAFTEQSDRFDAFVVPNAVMNAGDTFTLEVTFDDDSTEQVSRMINYVFKNIPALVNYGTPTTRVPFDITDPTANGTPEAPLSFDGTQDLALEFRPPPDETGAPITGMTCSFGFFFNDGDGQQLNANIDVAATWPTAIPGWEHGTSFEVTAEQLGELSEDGTYTVILPKELFVDEVVLTGGGTTPVASYKIDIGTVAPTGNAAVMLVFVKS